MAKGLCRDLCDRHYRRLRKYGDPNHVPAKGKVNGGPCSVDGCIAVVTTRGLGEEHCSALLRLGDSPALPAMLTDEEVAFIRQNRNLIRRQELADQLNTDVHTVIGASWTKLGPSSGETKNLGESASFLRFSRKSTWK